MTIKLSEEMKRFVEAQAAEEGYASPSDYLNAVLKEAQKRKARKNLEAKLDEALASGPSEPMTQEDWDELERRVWERDRVHHPEGTSCAVERLGSSAGAIPARQLDRSAGSNRSGGGGNEAVGAFDVKGRSATPRAGRPQRK